MRLSHWNRGQLPSGRPQSHWVMLELVKFDMRGHKYQMPRIQRFDLRESIRVRDEKSSAEGPRSEQANHTPQRVQSNPYSWRQEANMRYGSSLKRHKMSNQTMAAWLRHAVFNWFSLRALCINLPSRPSSLQANLRKKILEPATPRNTV